MDYSQLQNKVKNGKIPRRYHETSTSGRLDFILYYGSFLSLCHLGLVLGWFGGLLQFIMVQIFRNQDQELWSLAVPFIGTDCGAYSRYEAVYCRTFLGEAMLYWFRWAPERDVIPQFALRNVWVAWLCRSFMSPGKSTCYASIAAFFNNSWSGGEVCCYTGPSLDLSIQGCRRLCNLGDWPVWRYCHRVSSGY